MRSRKGITMMSLIIYVSSFLVVAGTIAGITAFFYGNSNLMTQELYSASLHLIQQIIYYIIIVYVFAKIFKVLK